MVVLKDDWSFLQAIRSCFKMPESTGPSDIILSFLLNFAEIRMKRTLCIVGIGNTIRGDDGIGSYLCDKLAALPLRQAVIKTAHQLSTDWLPELSGFDDVLLIDAGILEQPFYFGLLPSRPEAAANLSHHLDASLLAALLHRFFNPDTCFRLCIVSGSDFGFSETLSGQAIENSKQALVLVQSWLKENGYLD